jgi:acyl carrier protein
MQLDNRLVTIFTAIFPAETVRQMNLDSSTDTVEGWNSHTYVEIILAIETEFRLELSTLEAARMSSIRAIYELLGEKGIELEQ